MPPVLRTFPRSSTRKVLPAWTHFSYPCRGANGRRPRRLTAVMRHDGIGGSKAFRFRSVGPRPDAPRNFTAAIENNHVVLRWVPPSDSKVAVAYYTVELKTDDDTWKPLSNEIQGATQFRGYFHDILSVVGVRGRTDRVLTVLIAFQWKSS